jgi:hypothetical protein
MTATAQTLLGAAGANQETHVDERRAFEIDVQRAVIDSAYSRVGDYSMQILFNFVAWLLRCAN